MTLGEVIVRGAAGREVSRTTAAVFGGELVAVPVAVHFAGERLDFQADGSSPIGVTEGDWAPPDPIIFWKVESGYPPTALSLAEWRPSLPLGWLPTRSEEPPLRVEVRTSRRAGAFASFTAPSEIRFPGLFFQEGAVVGWTFGEPFDQAYLWAGAPEGGPSRTIKADRLFSAVSSDCREGYFRRLLDSGAWTTPAAELEAFAGGFRLASLLAPEDLPPDLRQSAIVDRMDALASDLIRNGESGEVARILDDRTIRESADPVLARDAVLALSADQDYNRTIRRLETIEQDVFEVRGLAPAELSELKSSLYKDWLRKILEKGDYYSGTVALEEARRAFPDDPEIRLLGVQIALSENDPGLARELLDEGDFPPALRERASRLAALLEAKQSESEDVIIRFDPGAEYIMVEAVLNGTYRQRFIIDTGASVVIIPPAAAVALKIEVDDSLPTTTVATASGVALAYEITLESISLENCTQENVKALVMDMPASPDFGLLGLNFLDAFSAELDRQNGILRLKKRPD
jgi:clan AA aspartic protease (TIGR02281 family)